MLWQGGFLFYALIVVPIGGDVLGSETPQGFITRRVSVWLNGFGVASLIAVFVDTFRTDSIAPVRRFAWFLAVILQITLYFLYDMMDRHLDPAQEMVIDRKAFYRLHAAYLIVSGLLWFVMVCNAILMLIAWRDVDARINPIIMDSEKPK